LLTTALVGAVLGSGGGCGATPCTPEEQGLGSATPLTIRQLPGRPTTSGACAHPRLEVISSQEELQRLYEELGVVASESSDAGDSSLVDFTRERVIVREGISGEGISWAVQRGETGYVGLLACGDATRSSCIVNVVAVPALITRVESRTCDAVACGAWQRR
jgi:hypothetical protein